MGKLENKQITGLNWTISLELTAYVALLFLIIYLMYAFMYKLKYYRDLNYIFFYSAVFTIVLARIIQMSYQFSLLQETISAVGQKVQSVSSEFCAYGIVFIGTIQCNKFLHSAGSIKIMQAQQNEGKEQQNLIESKIKYRLKFVKIATIVQALAIFTCFIFIVQLNLKTWYPVPFDQAKSNKYFANMNIITVDSFFILACFYTLLTIELLIAQVFLIKALDSDSDSENENQGSKRLMKFMSLIFTISFSLHAIFYYLEYEALINIENFFKKLMSTQVMFLIWDIPAILSFLLVNWRLVREVNNLDDFDQKRDKADSFDSMIDLHQSVASQSITSLGSINRYSQRSERVLEDVNHTDNNTGTESSRAAAYRIGTVIDQSTDVP